MAWIRTIPYAESTGKLRRLYRRVKGPDDNVDNIMLAHSLRPHTMEGHMALYKNVLHHRANQVPKWYLEALGVWTSVLNRCAYCVEHHAAGLARLLGDEAAARSIRNAFEAGEIPECFDEREIAGVGWARRLTLEPAELAQADIEALRQAGWTDGEVLELNQVVAYFGYANRTVLGLGVSTAGDILGLSPSGDGWHHR